MFLRAIVVTLLVSLALGEYQSPVLLWGVESPEKSALQTVKQNDFADLLAPLLKSHMVVAFQEEQLTSKDFLCQASDEEESCYKHLRGASPKTYFTAVQNPSEAVRTLTESREYNIVDSTGKLQAPLECTPGKVTIVNFDDVTSNERADVLEAHDAAINEIQQKLESCPVIYLYMSTPNSVKVRSRRDTAATNDGFIFQKSQFVIFWSSLSYNAGNGFNPVTISDMTIQNQSDTSFTVSMPSTSGKELTFSISLGTDGYYTMSSIAYDGQSFYSTLLNAPTTFSYHCGNLTLNTLPAGANPPPMAYLQWNSLQFQAMFTAQPSGDFKFGDSWDCVPFFTPGILSGLFVVILLLAIAFTGICWMIDINTMDRFDDPKGKTISINASD